MILEDITVEGDDANAILRSITVEDALRGLREAVAERGENYVYSPPAPSLACLYWHSKEGQPGCIVGLALVKLGVDSAVVRNLPPISIDYADIPIPEPAVEIFQAAQDLQDTRHSWGLALGAAEQKAAELSVSV